MNSNWKKEHIKEVIMIAPSWSGSGICFSSLGSSTFPFLPFLKSKLMKEFVRSLGGFYSHSPNPLFYENETVFISNSTNFTGSTYINEFYSEKYFSKTELQFIQQFVPTKEFIDIGVKSKILFNSRIKTEIGFEIQNKTIIRIYGQGDGIVGSTGIDYACNHWKDVECIDVNSTKAVFNHRNLIKSSQSLEILKKFFEINNESKSKFPEL